MTKWVYNLLFAAALLALAPLGAAADSYPSATIKIVVGFGPGSGTDILARLLAEQLQQSLEHPVIVENKPGAGAQIAATTVARAAPDGYTLFLTSNSSHSVNPHIYRTLSYDPKKDFTPIAGLAYFPFVLAIDPTLPPKTPQEFVAWARANSGKVTYAYGTPTVRIPAAALDHLLHLNATGVGYKSSPPAMMDVIGGQVSFLVTDLASSQAQIKQGQLRALAVTTSQRSELAPELPTIEETLGLKDFDLAAWTGLFGPANLPKEIVDRLSKAVVDIMNRPDIRARILALGAEPTPSDAATFAKLVDRQYEVWGQKVKDAGIEPE
ncbi:MAG TPA: tripartite tricarboxylate transporter substrate binding protein [Xanthobacteraceae bacterium]|nr:tripartite tricarboxylate transporter substrate binding protein [Xanthobacteraceae bacterium]